MALNIPKANQRNHKNQPILQRTDFSAKALSKSMKFGAFCQSENTKCTVHDTKLLRLISFARDAKTCARVEAPIGQLILALL
jgi:hypothetical protein